MKLEDTRDQKISTQIFSTNYENFIILAKSRKIPVVLITMPLNYDPQAGNKENSLRAGFAYPRFSEIKRRLDRLNACIRSMAEKYNLLLIDTAGSDMNKHPDYFVDLYHFSEKGAEVFAQKLNKDLVGLLQKLGAAEE